jgi:uncharacterized spore protein YtfJ
MTIETARDEATRSIEGQRADQLIERLVERIGARSGVTAVFGEPIERGEVAVIPVARVRWGVGAGGGTSEAERASGSGGGGGVAADAIGYLQIGPAGARFVSIERPWANPLLILTGAVGGALLLRALARLVR